VRQQKSGRPLAIIETWMKGTLAKLSKKSEMATVVNYSLNHRTRSIKRTRERELSLR
jgi:hypothetical protein